MNRKQLSYSVGILIAVVSVVALWAFMLTHARRQTTNVPAPVVASNRATLEVNEALRQMTGSPAPTPDATIQTREDATAFMTTMRLAGVTCVQDAASVPGLPDTLVVVVNADWQLWPHRVRLFNARAIQRAWESQRGTGHPHISIVTAAGVEIGGHSALSGVWVESD